MSATRSFVLSCVCGHEFKTLLWDSVHIPEETNLKSKILNGEINQIQCVKCKKRSYIEKNLLYCDSNQKLLIQMYPQSDRRKYIELESEHKKVIKSNPHLRGYTCRLAFGQQEMIEKIRIFDSNLDDRMIEMIKLKILEQDEVVKKTADADLLFSQYLAEEGELHFKLTSIEKNISQTIVISYEHYEELLESPGHFGSTKHPQKTICQGMYVNVNKTRTLH
ncbi:MAG: CpXC domain-containing protein [Deltaproteobacteria bacterium]